MKHLIAAVLTAAGLGLFAAAPAAAFQRPSTVVPDNDFITAVRDGRLEDVRAEMAKGTRVTGRDKEGRPAIIVAILFGQNDIALYLLENGANPDARDREGNTALCYLSQGGNAVMADALLEGGARPDRTCSNRDTPLLVAVRAGHAAVVDTLIRHGADIEASDLTGRTALSLAEERRFRDISSALQAAGAVY